MIQRERNHRRNLKSNAFKIAVMAAVVLINILFAITEATDKTYDGVPVFSDMNDMNRVYIETVYKDKLMSPSGGGAFGTDNDCTTSEAVYAAVCMYEDISGQKRSFDEYCRGNDDYENKALEYGILPMISSKGDEPLTRECLAAIFSRFAENEPTLASITEYANMDSVPFRDNAIALYNRGITLDKNLYEAYSPQKTVSRGDLARIITMIKKPELRTDDLIPDYGTLKVTLTDMMAGYTGQWSLYFEDCDFGNTISINKRQAYSASLIKLFVAQAVYTKISEGSLADTAETEDEIRRMLTYSDNDSWKSLAKKLGGGSYRNGMAYVTELSSKNGFSMTGQFMQGSHKNFNFTSVEDCGAYLRKLMNGEIVSPEYSERILGYLKQQQHRHKIPSGVPESVQTANKTGELEYVEGDAAIVYAPSGTYILVIIADEIQNQGDAQINIRSLSKTIYDYLNTQEVQQ